MHYVIGTDINVTTQPISQGIRSITDQRSRQIKNTTPFKPNVTYSIYNIRMLKEEVEYHFARVGGPSEDDIIMKFGSTHEADQLIASAKSEQLPNYDQFHRDKSA